jgi:hypothetical protein
MSVIDRIDDMLLSEAKLRGFKDKKALAAEIEDMDANVIDREVLKFTGVMEKYLKKVDPEPQWSIAKAVMKLKDRDAVALYDDLLQFSYKD